MNLAKIALEKKTITLVLTLVFLIGGLVTYTGLPRLEDPEFTIKDALVITPYPGASAEEVEAEVTDEIEMAVQQLGQLKEVESKSDRGLSTVQLTIKDKYDKDGLPQVWDELRRKVGDAQQNLPPGAGPSMVIDDFGDVYGVFLAVYGDDFSYAELWDVVKMLRRELLLVQDVAKIAVFGEQSEAIYVELNRDRLSQLGIPASAILNELRQKNLVAAAGRVKVGDDFLTIDPTGTFQSVADIEELLIHGGNDGQQFYLRDVATVSRGYTDPPRSLIRFDGKQAIGLGISTVAGGNVVTVGDGIEARMRELVEDIPMGVQFGVVSLQSETVSLAISNFVISLVEAIAIVIAVLLFFMGVRSGFLIGFVLLLTISASFIFMGAQGVTLQRISLGALIIALGMLVDNAIVVVDGMLIKAQRGKSWKEGAIEVVKQTSIPLLGATVVAVLAFAAIGTSQDKTGEFCRSLYQVIMISLLLSWVTAVTVTPLLGTMFLKIKKLKPGEVRKDPYDTGFYRRFQGFLLTCIRARWVTVAVVLVVFAASLWGFGFVDKSFFPDSTRPQFMLDYWLPQGTHISRTTEEAKAIEEYILAQEGVTHVTSLVGQGGLRFILTYTAEKLNPAYVQFLIDVDDYKMVAELSASIQSHLEQNFSDGMPAARKFMLGPGEPGKIQARFFGQDPDVLRDLAGQAATIMRNDPQAYSVMNDWHERVKTLRPIVAEDQANLNGITSKNIADVLLQGFQGATVGVFREADELLPIIARASEEQRMDVASIQSLQIWSPAAQRMIPLRQVVSGFETVFEDEIIFRMDRKRAIIVLCDALDGKANALLARLQPGIEAIELPDGYTLEWWGEFKSSGEAQASLVGSIPLFMLIMVLMVVLLFNNLRQPLVIWLTVPLALIGVTVGLLLTNQPFGFMALLGFLSLSGMLIKNAIVLIDEINLQVSEGKELMPAIVDSATSRLRPVGMAAATTILGMAPLFLDAFFVAMAVTIAFGLGFATVLTMIVVPVLYAIVYKVRDR